MKSKISHKKTAYQEILNSSLLKKIRDKAKKSRLKVYLVGGFLRDLLLKRPRQDYDVDFAVAKNSIRFARSLARDLKLPFVLLDKQHGSCRIVLKKENLDMTLDFTDFRGPDLKTDLLHRDFVINTLALDLEDLAENKIIDLYQAKKDLAKKIIRAAHPKAFDEDPVRILRAFSMLAMLDFKIDKATLKQIKIKSAKLKRTAAERIQEELFKILASERAHKTFLEMDAVKFLSRLFPELDQMRGIDQGPYHHLDVFWHTLATLDELEKFFKELKKFPIKNKNRLLNYLNEDIASGHKRFSVLKLGALLHDLGKPKVRVIEKDGRRTFHGHERAGLNILEKICARFKLSNQEQNSLKRIMLHHLRPGYLSDHAAPSSRSIFRYFRDAGDDAVGILLISLADARATRGPFKSRADLVQHERIIFKLIDEFFDEKERIKPKKIIDGFDIMKALKIKPGPLVGELLLKIQEAQAEGRIKNKLEAINFAKKAIKS